MEYTPDTIDAAETEIVARLWANAVAWDVAVGRLLAAVLAAPDPADPWPAAPAAEPGDRWDGLG